MSKKNQAPSVHGEYNSNGYQIWCGGQVVYSAGNHVQDSTQPAMTAQDRLPLRTIRQFCTKTAHEIADELNGTFGVVERVDETDQ